MAEPTTWAHDEAVTRAFYGAVVNVAVVTVFAAESLQPPPAKAIGGVVVSAVILFIAHGFAELVPRIARSGRLTRSDLRTVSVDEFPLLAVAVIPIVPLALGAMGALDQSAAYRVSVGVTLLALFLLAIGLCRREGLSWGRTFAAGLAIAAGTSLVIYLEALITH
jgi:hypothetical protein